MDARTLLENPDRLLHILQPLVASTETASGEKEQDFGKLMEQLKAIYGSKYPALKERIEDFRYFHVVREETQYLWETVFYYVRKCLERTNMLLLSDTDYEHGVANLFAEELIAACERGSLSESDKEKIERRNSKHPLAQKVWDASKLLVFDADGDVLKGVSGSTGTAIGKVCIIHGPEEFYKMQKGDVLVCQLTDPEWTPLFNLASAVVADVIDCAKHEKRKKLFGWGAPEENYVIDYRTLETALYIRAKVTGNKDDVLKKIGENFGKVKYLTRNGAPEDEIAFVTDKGIEKVLTDKLAKTEGIDVLSTIRVTDY